MDLPSKYARTALLARPARPVVWVVGETDNKHRRPFPDRCHRPKPLRLLAIPLLIAMAGGLGPSFVSAQSTNRTANMRAATSRIMVTAPTVTRLRTNATTRPNDVEVKLPNDLRRYHILDKTTQTPRAATDVTAVSSNRVRANIPLGRTLLFMEKDAPAPTKAGSVSAVKPLFTTYMVKATPAARPGEAPRTASGTLTLLADVPTPWVNASNAYVTRLSVMFLSDDPTPNNGLLPMAVEFRGSNITAIEPRKVELQKAGVEGSEEVLITCDRYRSDVAITAFYQSTNTVRELTLQRLTVWDMTQMIISVPMLFASLVGGLMGGLLRLFKGRSWATKRIVHYLAEGGIVGLVTVTMLLAGLLHDQVAGLSGSPQLVLAFSLAAAAGSVGAHFLDAAIAKLRGQKS